MIIDAKNYQFLPSKICIKQLIVTTVVSGKSLRSHTSYVNLLWLQTTVMTINRLTQILEGKKW